MKKTNIVKGIVAAFTATMLFVACSTPVSGAIDTVGELQAPGNLTAIAYPGVNYVSWDIVQGAQGYCVKKVVDGVRYDFNTSTTANYIYDTAIKNDKMDVTYEVYAKSNTNPSKAVYVYDSKVSKVTVKCIFPAAGTLATDLPKYENNSGWNFDENADNSKWEKAKYVPSAETIKVVTLNDYTKKTSGFVVTSPAKRYLKTNVTMKLDGFTVAGVSSQYYADYQVNGPNGIGETDPTNFNGNENATARLSVPTLGAGNWTYIATVTSVNEVYQPAFIELTDKFEKVKALSDKIGTATGTVTAKYIDEGKTARVYFTPATKSDKITNWDLANYVVYREFDGEFTKLGALSSSELVETSGTTAGNNSTVYYIDDNAIPSNKVAYNYYVVLSDNNEYESGVKKGTLAAYVPLTMTDDITTFSASDPYAADSDGKKNDIEWTIKLKNKYQTFKAYLISKPKFVSTSVNDINFTPDFLKEVEISGNKIAKSSTDDLTFTIYTKDIDDATAYMLIIISEKDKLDRYKIASKAPATVADVTWPTSSAVTVKVYDDDLNNNNNDNAKTYNDVEINVTDVLTIRANEVEIDSINNYTYELFMAKSVLESQSAGTLTWRTDSENWKSLGKLTMKDAKVYDTSKGTTEKTYSAFHKELNLPDGEYGFKVVKTNINTGKFATKGISFATINTKSGYSRQTANITAGYDTSVVGFDTDKDKEGKVLVTFKFNRNTLSSDLKRWQPGEKSGSVTIAAGDAILSDPYYKEVAPFEHEKDVKYTLYRAVIDSRNDNPATKNIVETVYEKVGDVLTQAKTIPSTAKYQLGYYDNSGALKTNEIQPVMTLEYTFELDKQDTSKTYNFVVIASKEGNPDIVMGTATCTALAY